MTKSKDLLELNNAPLNGDVDFNIISDKRDKILNGSFIWSPD
jgi:hypothetical protein